MTYLDSRTGLISSMFLLKTVILYHYIIQYSMNIQSIIFAAPGFLQRLKKYSVHGNTADIYNHILQSLHGSYTLIHERSMLAHN